MSKHPLAGLGNFDRDERTAKDEWFHEEAVVKALLAVYRNSARAEILKLSKIRTGQPHLSLKLLREVTGISDKFVFEAMISPDIGKSCAIDKMLRQFETRNFVKRFHDRYDEHLQSDLGGLDYALIIRCPFVPIGLVMHTATDTVFAKGYRFVVASRNFDATLETFDQFVKTELRGAGR